MSASLDLVRSILADWGRGDFSSAEWADSQIEYLVVEGPSSGSWKGVPAMWGAFQDWLSAWEGWTVEPERYRELDGERIFAIVTTSGHGRSSGLGGGQFTRRGANLFHVRDGKVTKLVIYWDHDRALADLGLTPEDDAPGEP